MPHNRLVSISTSNGRGRVPAFTIVELLIVIVVIGILAAISIVAYNGISERARQSSASSAASQAHRKISAYLAEHGALPANLEAAGLSSSQGGTSLQYSSTPSSTPP